LFSEEEDDDPAPAFANVGGPTGLEDWPPIKDGGPCTDDSLASWAWLASSDDGLVAAVRFGCAGEAAFICDVAGIFELDETTRGRVADVAPGDDDAAVEGFEFDLPRPALAPFDGKFERALFPAALDVLTPLD
jgi:hypothetical protein